MDDAQAVLSYSTPLLEYNWLANLLHFGLIRFAGFGGLYALTGVHFLPSSLSSSLYRLVIFGYANE